MSISNISATQAAVLSLISAPGGAPAGYSAAALAGVASGSDSSAVIANLAVASSGVSSALQSLSGALGNIINTTA